MNEPAKPNGAAMPLPVPEGDKYLFVRLERETGGIQVLFSTIEDCALLLKLGEQFFDGMISDVREAGKRQVAQRVELTQLSPGQAAQFARKHRA